MSLNYSTSNSPVITVQDGSNNNKNKDTDIFTWFLAWSLFFQVSLIFRAHLAEKMAKCQLFIAQLATQYYFNSWYNYDQAFRLFVANNPLFDSWDKCNEDIYNVQLRGPLADSS